MNIKKLKKQLCNKCKKILEDLEPKCIYCGSTDFEYHITCYRCGVDEYSTKCKKCGKWVDME